MQSQNLSDKLSDFGFTKLVVADLAKSADFYKTVCGLTEQFRYSSTIAGRKIDEILFNATYTGGPTFVLLSFPDSPKSAPGESILGFTTPDLEAFLGRVGEAGGTVAEGIRVMEEMKLKVAFVRDVEGHLLEVVQML